MRHRPLALLLASLSLCLLGQVTVASAFSNVFFFGDSFTDTGNFGPVDASPFLPSVYGYDPDRWTNAGGTLWVDDFAATLGFASAATARSDGGNNYATGGARADELTSQITTFAGDVSGTADPNSLYVVWAGGNDLLQGQSASSTVVDVVNAILALSALGAEHFMVANVPDFSPLAPGTGPLAGVRPIPPGANVWASDFNSALAVALSGLSGPTIYAFDLAGVLDPIVADPTGSGFSQGLNLCSLNASCIAGIGAEDFLMHDHLHFTSQAHDLISAGALAAIPEPGTVLLVMTGLVVLAARWKRRA